jgi:hypothetical protein
VVVEKKSQNYFGVEKAMENGIERMEKAMEGLGWNGQRIMWTKF